MDAPAVVMRSCQREATSPASQNPENDGNSERPRAGLSATTGEVSSSSHSHSAEQVDTQRRSFLRSPDTHQLNSEKI